MEAINCRLFIIPRFMKKHIYLLLFIIGALTRVLFPDILEHFSPLDDGSNNSNKNQNGTNSTNISNIITFLKDMNDGANKTSSNNTDIKQLQNLLTQSYIEIIYNVLSAVLLGIPHFLNKMRNKEENKNRRQQTYITNNQNINFIYLKNESSRIPLMFKIIFIISSVDVFCQLTVPIKYIIEYNYFPRIQSNHQSHFYSVLFFDIFARYFFSRWILKTYFYIHHKLSFILSIIGLIPISIVDFLAKYGKDEEEYNWLFISVISIQLIVYSFEDIMNKVAFRTLSILPYTLIFYNGLIQFGYFIIISIFFFLFQLYDRYAFDYLHELKKSICFLPFNILRNYYLMKVIDTFSAQYMALLRITETSIIFMYDLIKYFLKKRFVKHNQEEEKIYEIYGKIYPIIIQFLGFLILLVASLIHNEIIIINHRKLKAKTQFYLDKDADKEQNVSINSDTCFSDSGTNSVTNLYDDLTGSDMS